MKDATTSNGTLADLPVLERTGYEFQGWWISMTDNSSELTSKYEAGEAIKGETTLYAMWIPVDTSSKLPEPIVQVEADVITRNSISGARSYQVVIKNEEGVVVSKIDSAATTVKDPFASLDAGKYEITVIAFANTGEENNSQAVRFFVNKALDKVTDFDVIGSILIFNTVEHAEKYFITVTCKNPDYVHDTFDNGTSKVFNLANCIMPPDGIRVSVTAVAEGYTASTSREFVYKKILNAVEGLTYDSTTETVSWNKVNNAAYYMVSVLCVNPSHEHGFVNNGTKTYVNLRSCDALADGIVVKVYPVTEGYASPAASEMKANKTTLAAPENIRINDTVITWPAVTGATSYEVYVNGTKHSVSENTFDLSDIANSAESTS